MKHLAKIQSEFLRHIATVKWSDLTWDQQIKYLREHPKSKKEPNYSNRKDTKEHYLHGMHNWVQHEQHHKKLAVTISNFMHKYLPEKFNVKVFDEDTGNVPNFDELVKKFGLKIYLDEQSGDDIEESTAVVDEKSETTAKRFSGGEYLATKIATGIYEGKRMIINEHERYGLAPVMKDGKEIRKQPYGSYGIEIITGK
jgi:hypothetical protein